MSVVSKFLKGKWMEKARGYASNPQRLKILLLQLGGYLSKNGLSSAKETLVLMKNYLYDISTGRYKGYDIKKLSIVVAAIIYVITPIDLVPDFIPPGFLDDLTIIGWALKQVASELERYKQSLQKGDEEPDTKD